MRKRFTSFSSDNFPVTTKWPFVTPFSKNQISTGLYINKNTLYRNSVKNCHSYHSADGHTDNNLVTATMKQIRYKKIRGAKRQQKRK